MTPLFEPTKLGSTELRNRIFMAPMTRSRAGEGNVPTDSTVEYYVQRAEAGHTSTEGTQPSAVGQGYPWTPGIHNDTQEAGWRRVADGVHAKGGHIYLQLMHCGRISHTSFQPDGGAPVAPSAVPAVGDVFTGEKLEPFSMPRALERDEIPLVQREFAEAAERAVRAGMDGVELHGANGYLLHQFLASDSNRREDEYGDTPEGRARFVIETVKLVAEAIGAERTSLRLSPGNPNNDIVEADPEPTYRALLEGIAPLGLAYVHVYDNAPGSPFSAMNLIRSHWAGKLVANSGGHELYDRKKAESLLTEGGADFISFGRMFLANPDLVERLRQGAPLNEADPATFYGGDERGYTDYPTLQETRAS